MFLPLPLSKKDSGRTSKEGISFVRTNWSTSGRAHLIKKNSNLSLEQQRQLVSTDRKLSIQRQCALLGIAQSSYYYEPLRKSAENLHLTRLMDEQYLYTPFYSYRLMWARL